MHVHTVKAIPKPSHLRDPSPEQCRAMLILAFVVQPLQDAEVILVRHQGGLETSRRRLEPLEGSIYL